MAKSSGLNVRLYVAGNDLSGDANSLSTIGYTNNLYEITTLDSSAVKRLLGTVDGTLGVSGFFDNRSGGIHATFSSNSGKLPTADVNVLVPIGSGVGDSCYGLVAKEAEYNTDRGTEAVTVNSSFNTSGYAPQFGVMLTAHDDTHSSATNGTSVDNAASSSNGGSGFLQVMALASGTATVKVQHSSNNSTFTDLVTFTAVTGSTSEYKEVTGTVNRYIRVASTGTFSGLQLAVGFSRT